jgi:hypothetical protein
MTIYKESVLLKVRTGQIEDSDLWQREATDQVATSCNKLRLAARGQESVLRCSPVTTGGHGVGGT